MLEIVLDRPAVFREQVAESAAKVVRGSLEFAWLSAQVQRTEAYKGWGFGSFLEYLQNDIANQSDPSRNFFSISYAYTLAKVGTCFLPYRAEIEAGVLGKAVSIRTLIKLQSLVQQGLPIADAVAFLRGEKELPKEYAKKTSNSDTEAPVSVSTYVRRGDVSEFKRVLLMYAVAHGHRTLNDAHNALVLDTREALDQILDQAEALKTFRRFRPMIDAGIFFCHKCGNIPRQPTLHHLLPRSIGQGFGPVVLLCAEPCHYSIVQPKWEFFCSKWYGDPDELKRAAEDHFKKHNTYEDADTMTKLVV